jgi:serine/threonine-protein kinase
MVERFIRRGGMGEVYAARNTTTGEEVALKRIRVDAGPDNVWRFTWEARAASAIRHPNVVDVFELFREADGTPVIVMELLKGEPLSDYCKRMGALELHEAAQIFLPVAHALRAVHDLRIVHRDLKPDNLFLAQTAAGLTTKVLDFSIAKILDRTKISAETLGHQPTTKSPVGTPRYMSFEQAMSEEQVDHRTDIWSLGVMIFEAITGRRPFVYETLGQMYASLLQGRVPSIRELVPDLPRDFGDVLDHCLAKQPSDRLDDLVPLINVLAKYSDPNAPGAHAGGRIVEVSPAEAASISMPPLVLHEARPKRRPRAVLVAGALAIAGAGIGASALTRLRQTPPIQRISDTRSALTPPSAAPTDLASVEPPTGPPARSIAPAPVEHPPPPATTRTSRPPPPPPPPKPKVDPSGLARENPFNEPKRARVDGGR